MAAAIKFIQDKERGGTIGRKHSDVLLLLSCDMRLESSFVFSLCGCLLILPGSTKWIFLLAQQTTHQKQPAFSMYSLFNNPLSLCSYHQGKRTLSTLLSPTHGIGEGRGTDLEGLSDYFEELGHSVDVMHSCLSALTFCNVSAIVTCDLETDEYPYLSLDAVDDWKGKGRTGSRCDRLSSPANRNE